MSNNSTRKLKIIGKRKRMSASDFSHGDGDVKKRLFDSIEYGYFFDVGVRIMKQDYTSARCGCDDVG